MSDHWIADRMRLIDASGIRKVFDLAANMTDPINLSIGQPDFPTPEPAVDAFCEAARSGKTGYSQTQGIAPLREAIQQRVDERYGHPDRQAFITSGTSGGLMLSLSVLINPGDEVIIFDPYFVMYKHLVRLAGGEPVVIPTYPTFHIDIDQVREAITERTKVIIFNSPANPTGTVATREEAQQLAELAAEKNVVLLSDEIYREFCPAGSFVSPCEFNDQTLVIDGFSKSHAMTGLRVGFAHGPQAIIREMMKLQQFTFVCAPHPSQWAALSSLAVDVSGHAAEYDRKRQMLIDGLKDDYRIEGAGGAFYLFIEAPWGTGTEFVKTAIENNLLIIPGNVFSERDTHFRISYAATDETLQRGIEVLKKIARR